MIVPVKTNAQVSELAALARNIWNEYYPSIITADQVSYMIENFQSTGTILQQIDDGYEYYFVMSNNDQPVRKATQIDKEDVKYINNSAAGYFAIKPESSGKLFLSKAYIKKEYRGKGFLGVILSFIENVCRDRELNAVYLTVNKHNHDAIAAYQKKGFVTVREQVVDIGGGFAMDDLVMEKNYSKK